MRHDPTPSFPPQPAQRDLAASPAAAAVDLRRAAARDRTPLREFYSGLSPRTIEDRFGVAAPAVPPSWLPRLTDVTAPGRVVVVAVAAERIVGVAEAAADPRRAADTEVGLVVADGWQGRGLGGALLHVLLGELRADDVSQRLLFDVSPRNRRMHRLLERARLRRSIDRVRSDP
jgi:acetyltransferase